MQTKGARGRKPRACPRAAAGAQEQGSGRLRAGGSPTSAPSWPGAPHSWLTRPGGSAWGPRTAPSWPVLLLRETPAPQRHLYSVYSNQSSFYESGGSPSRFSRRQTPCSFLFSCIWPSGEEPRGDGRRPPAPGVRSLTASRPLRKPSLQSCPSRRSALPTAAGRVLKTLTNERWPVWCKEFKLWNQTPSTPY